MKVSRRRSPAVQLEAIRAHAGPMSWQPTSSFKRVYELRAGVEILGMLRWEKACGSLAVAECAHRAWTFKRGGFLSPRVTVRTPGSDLDSAVLSTQWRGGGTLRVLGGRSYRWSNTSLLRSSWAFSTDSDELLVSLRPRFSLMRHHAEVMIEPRAVSLEDLELLVLLAGYLLILISDDAAAALAAAAV